VESYVGCQCVEPWIAKQAPCAGRPVSRRDGEKPSDPGEARAASRSSPSPCGRRRRRPGPPAPHHHRVRLLMRAVAGTAAARPWQLVGLAGLPVLVALPACMSIEEVAPPVDRLLAAPAAQTVHARPAGDALEAYVEAVLAASPACVTPSRPRVPRLPRSRSASRSAASQRQSSARMAGSTRRCRPACPARR